MDEIAAVFENEKSVLSPTFGIHHVVVFEKREPLSVVVQPIVMLYDHP
jgi:hypothetical protein